jgi:hypothetical protein
MLHALMSKVRVSALAGARSAWPAAAMPDICIHDLPASVQPRKHTKILPRCASILQLTQGRMGRKRMRMPSSLSNVRCWRDRTCGQGAAARLGTRPASATAARPARRCAWCNAPVRLLDAHAQARGPAPWAPHLRAHGPGQHTHLHSRSDVRWWTTALEAESGRPAAQIQDLGGFGGPRQASGSPSMQASRRKPGTSHTKGSVGQLPH